MKTFLKTALILTLPCFFAYAQNLKINTAEVGKIKVSADGTTLNFNFLVKSVKPILKQEDAVTIALLDKGLVIAPNYDNVNGVLVVTNEKGDSYSIRFETSKDSNGADPVYNFTDTSYSKEDDVDFNFESSNIEQDVTNIIKSLDNGVELSGFETTRVPYSINNDEFKMDRVERFIGSKYVVEKWVITNKTDAPLYFENRDFASEGIIAISFSPEELQENASGLAYFIINKSTILNSDK